MMTISELRAAHPKATPAELFDLVAKHCGSDLRWDISGIESRCNWLDCLACTDVGSRAQH